MNKIGFKKRTVCAVLVSVICILLASSFVFHTVAEASVLTYSLQGASFGNYINDDGTISSNGLDLALIDNYSVTAQNQYALSGTTQENFSLSGNVYSAVSTYAVPVWDCSSAYAAYLTSSGGTDVRLYTANGVVEKTYSVSPKLFFSDRFLSGSSVYDLEGNHLGDFNLSSSYSVSGCFFRDDKYILFASTSRYYIMIFDSDFNQLFSQETPSANGSFYCTDKYAVRFSTYTIYVFDLVTFDFSELSNGAGTFYGYVTQIGDRLFRLYNKVFYVYDLELNYLFSYTASNLGVIDSKSAILNNFFGSFIIDNTSASYTIASFPNQYYTDFSAHFVDSFTPSKWVNFSYKPSTDGSVVGGNAVSIKLDYALSDEYLSTVYTYGVKVSGYTMLASLDDLSTDTGYYGLPPLVVKVNGSVVPRITKQYESVEKVGDVYLYAFSAFCDFQGSTKINSLEIYMNCFVPEQLSRHSFSLPVSDVELYLEPAGGGGGESSGGGSSGGESSGGGSSGGGSSATNIYKFDNGNVELIDTIDLSKAQSVRAFLGYFLSTDISWGDIQTPLTLFVYNEDNSIDTYEYNFYAMGYSITDTDASSFVYPDIVGDFFEIPINGVENLYFSTKAPFGSVSVQYGSSFSCTFNLVNGASSATIGFLSEGYYVSVSNSPTGPSTRTFDVTVDRYRVLQIVGQSNSVGRWEMAEDGDTLSFTGDSVVRFGTTTIEVAYGDQEDFPWNSESYDQILSGFEDDKSYLEWQESYINSLANGAYGQVSFDPNVSTEFNNAVDIFNGIVSAEGGEIIFGFFGFMWQVHPFAVAMVFLLSTFAIVTFIVRKV